MEHQHPKAIVLPGAERWHRGNVISHASDCGLIPILAVQNDEEVVIDGPVQKAIGGILNLSAIPDERELLDLANRLNRICKCWFVLPLDDYVSEAASRLSQYATLPCFPHASAQEVFHKHQLRKRWNEFCREHPDLPLAPIEYALYTINGASQLPDKEISLSSENFKQSKGSFIVKPDAYSGSVAVFRAIDLQHVSAAVEQSAAVMERESVNPEMKGIVINQGIVAEEEVPRKPGLAGCAEFTAHYLSFKGKHLLLGIAEKMIDPSTFIETAHVFPSPSFPAELLPVLEQTIAALLEAMQVQNTISNWEFIITPDDRLALVEGQLRPSGDHVMELIENAILFSPYVLFFRALDEGFLPLEKISAVHTSVICWPRPSVTMERISHIDIPEKMPLDIHFSLNRDALLQSRDWKGPLTWYDRHVSIMATGANAAQAWQKCHHILDACHLKGIAPDGKHVESALVFP